jgi:hypothetical protein
LRYDLELERAKFAEADRVVRAVLLRSGKALNIYMPGLVTSDQEQLAPKDKSYILDNPSSLGVCFKDNDSNSFDIWVSPSFDPNHIGYKDTVLHELCHGYLGAYKHSHRWLRFFGRVLCAYDAIVEPMENQLPNALRRYMDQHPDENYGKYMERLEMEQTSIEKISIDELAYVSYTYNRLAERETRPSA